MLLVPSGKNPNPWKLAAEALPGSTVTAASTARHKIKRRFMMSLLTIGETRGQKKRGCLLCDGQRARGRGSGTGRLVLAGFAVFLLLAVGLRLVRFIRFCCFRVPLWLDLLRYPQQFGRLQAEAAELFIV